MAKHRVLLLCAQALLGESLEHILSTVEDVELLGSRVLDAQLLARLFTEVPDIVLIAEEEGESESVATLIAQILEQYPDLPIARVGLMQNIIRLYTSRTLPARSADLIETIRSLPAR
ncbi:MAG: hypothetical protein M5U01_36475 [Ardenticatenaceae bacterium]|nr:hypothetical protein [Ardenticatenaceae bacterium]HBY92430.1 hypothetical protein [Chloroflexota bacterium]